MKRIKILLNALTVTSIVLFVLCVAIYFLLQKKIDLQQNIINSQDDLLKNAKSRDSIYTENNKEYAKTIKRYTSDENCSITIDGKLYSFSEFIALYGKLNSESYKIKDSLRYFKEADKQVAIKLRSIISESKELDKKNKKYLDSIKQH